MFTQQQINCRQVPDKSWPRKKEVKLKTNHNYLSDCELRNLCPVRNAALPVQQVF